MRIICKLAVVLALVSGLDCPGQVAGGGAAQPPLSPEFVQPAEGFTGMVRDASGKPAAGVPVSFRVWDAMALFDSCETKTDQNGAYLVRGKAINGRQVLNVQMTTNLVVARDVERNLAAIGGFSLFSGIPRNLDLTLQPGLCVSGSVRDKEGAPVTNATVTLTFNEERSTGDSRFEWGVLLPEVEVDGRGLFTFAALPQGRSGYAVSVVANGYGVGNAYIGSAGLNTDRYEFAPFVLKRADRRLAGKVVMGDGTPAVQVWVNFEGEGQPPSPGTVKSGKEGQFVFESVCEGPIRVSAHNGMEGGDVLCQGGNTNVVVTFGVTHPRLGGGGFLP
jgi:hypothetical protein